MNSFFRSAKSRVRRLFMSPAARRFDLVGPPELWEMKRKFQFDFLKQHGLMPHHHLVDIGCGVLRGGLPLIDYLEAGHYYGIEARPYVLAEGCKELNSANLAHKRPQFIIAEHLAEVRLHRTFDYIWAFSVLIHLSDEILAGLCRFVGNHLSPNGVFFANVDTTSGTDGRWQEFPGVRRPLAFYQETFAQYGLEITDLGTLADFGHHTGGEADQNRMLEVRFDRATLSARSSTDSAHPSRDLGVKLESRAQ